MTKLIRPLEYCYNCTGEEGDNYYGWMDGQTDGQTAYTQSKMRRLHNLRYVIGLMYYILCSRILSIYLLYLSSLLLLLPLPVFIIRSIHINVIPNELEKRQTL